MFYGQTSERQQETQVTQRTHMQAVCNLFVNKRTSVDQSINLHGV
jgi:hypothetical protein